MSGMKSEQTYDESSSSSSSSGSSPSIKEYQEPAAFRDATAAFTVSYVSRIDMLVLRFVRQLEAASNRSIQFSHRRYGLLVGQLLPEEPVSAPSSDTSLAQDQRFVTASWEMESSSSKTDKPEPVPTTADNLESRLFMCLQAGCSAVERAIVVYRTQGISTHLQRITLLDILENKPLMTNFATLAASIKTETALDAGIKFSTTPLILDEESTRKGLLLKAAHLASYASPETSDGVLEPVSVQVPENTDRMSGFEVEHFVNLKEKQLDRVHHLLRLCMDAALVRERDFISAGRYVWDVPTDVPADALILHLQGPLAQALDAGIDEIFMLGAAVRRPFENQSDALRWLTCDHNRMLLFVELVATQFHSSQNVSRQANVRIVLMNRLRNNYNLLLSALALRRCPGCLPLVHQWLKKASEKRRK